MLAHLTMYVMFEKLFLRHFVKITTLRDPWSNADGDDRLVLFLTLFV